MTQVTAEASREANLQNDIKKFLLLAIKETAAAGLNLDLVNLMNAEQDRPAATAVTLNPKATAPEIAPHDSLNKLKISTFNLQYIIDDFNNAYGTNLVITESDLSACVQVKDFIKLVTDAYSETNR